MAFILDGSEHERKGPPPMTFGKRWRVIVAALFQDWHLHVCSGCRTEWFCQCLSCGRGRARQCPDCETRALMALHHEMTRKRFGAGRGH